MALTLFAMCAESTTTEVKVMGIVNVTPDSFSDGGKWLDPEAAIAHGKVLAAQGAHILDVGGESTRPGAAPVSIDEELARVIPVIEGLRGISRISIDTRHADVARSAVLAGATLLNDISASLWQTAADTNSGWIGMHMQGEPGTMQQQPQYEDVVREVRDYLVERAESARAEGVREIWIDPGFGFGKTLGHNLELLRNLRTFAATAFPLAVGLSRKTFLGTLTAANGEPPAPAERDAASLAAAVWAITNGAGMIRVHDVQGAVQATRVIAAIQQSRKVEEQAA